jgi:hypothetical protein
MDKIIGIDITPDDSVTPVFLIKPTSGEVAEREQWAADTAAAEQALVDEKKAQEDALASAHAKLTKLGLTPEEISALTGRI